MESFRSILATANTTSEPSNFFKLLISKTPKSQLLRIQLNVLVTTILLILLFLIGSVRHRIRFKWWLKSITKVIYVLIPIYITYIMGLMHNASTLHVLYPVWACALIYAYGGVVTMSACDLKDNDDTLQYFWRTLPLFFWTIWLGIIVIINKQFSPILLYTFVIFSFAAYVNTRETLEAFYLASKSKGLPRIVEPTVRYMSERERRDDQHVPDERDIPPNPTEMTGYRYFVWNDLITTEEIWNSVGNEGLKDLCLSFAFYNLIIRRFAGFSMDESFTLLRRRRAWRFIRDGFLFVDPPRLERLFYIIEVELHFVFDFFYTKSHICSSYRFIDMWRHVLVVIGLCAFSTVGISLVSSESSAPLKVFSIQYHGHSLEVGITRAVIIIFLVLESWKFIMIWFSNRKMVWSLCTGLQQTAANEGCGLIVIIWKIKHYLSRRGKFGFKPWQRKLGQYSFLKSYRGVPMCTKMHKTLANRVVKIPRVGQIGDSTVALSMEVKKAIVSSLMLVNEELVLFCGTTTIARYNNIAHQPQLPQELADACALESSTHVILVWHIATSFCKSLHPEVSDHFHVATQLSKYCAYLVAFAPELLPGQPYSIECVFDEAVQQAHLHVVGLTVKQRHQNLMIMNNVDPDVNSMVVKGAVLADRLINEVIPNQERGWKFLAEFWAELLLYLAPSDDVAAHGDYLAKGGEFITHLWALLTHAGFVTRSISCSPMGN